MPKKAYLKTSHNTTNGSKQIRPSHLRAIWWLLVVGIGSISIHRAILKVVGIGGGQLDNNNNNTSSPSSLNSIMDDGDHTRERTRIHAPQTGVRRRRITFDLHAGTYMNNTFNPVVNCGNHRVLHPAMANATNVLDVTAHLATDLHILILGDSVGMQFYHTLEEAVGVVHESDRRLLAGQPGGKDLLSVAAPVRGGGVVAGMRLQYLLCRAGENQTAFPGAMDWKGFRGTNHEGGWNRQQVQQLLDHTYTVSTSSREHSDSGETTTRRSTMMTGTRQVQSFDIVVVRVTHGWMSLREITRERLTETVELSNEIFGATTVIVISLPFVNNVGSMEQLQEMKETNDMMRHFTRSWEAGRSGIRHVLLLEFGRYADLLLEWNARLIGYDTTRQRNYSMEFLAGIGRVPQVKKSIAQHCGQPVAIGSRGCPPNAVSMDGMHWCMKTLGGRFFAGLACLMQCATRNNDDDDVTLRDCEDDCNDRFMSLEPVDDARMSPRHLDNAAVETTVK